MWTITTGTDEGIVVNRFEGKFDTDFLLKYVKSNIYCWAIYPVIWDLSKADLSTTATEELNRCAEKYYIVTFCILIVCFKNS